MQYLRNGAILSASEYKRSLEEEQRPEVMQFLEALPRKTEALNAKIREHYQDIESRLLRMTVGNLEGRAQVIDAIAMRKGAGY